MTTFTSYSKINLHLKVTAKRPDGYHELESIFLPLANPADTISIAESTSGFALSCSNAIVPQDSSNICWKAIEAFYAAARKTKNFEISTNWKINIEKTIPVAAGLGGGSSNAAVILNFMNDHYKLFNNQELCYIAKSIGADVPFFLKPEPAIVKGIGEDITYISLPMDKLPLLIIAPHFPVSAKWCYQNLSKIEPSISRTDSIISAFKNHDWQTVGALLENDLAQPVFAKFPIMDIICQQAKECNIHRILMSGSGPTLFAICQDKNHAVTVKKKLEAQFPETFSFHLNDHPPGIKQYS
jgi:4-diphosphocytidyl-2-C-methyl-D-erythritol kinase